MIPNWVFGFFPRSSFSLHPRLKLLGLPGNEQHTDSTQTMQVKRGTCNELHQGLIFFSRGDHHVKAAAGGLRNSGGNCTRVVVCACMAYEACRMTHCDQVSHFSTFYSPCFAALSSLEWPLPFTLLAVPPISPLTVTARLNKSGRDFQRPCNDYTSEFSVPYINVNIWPGFLALTAPYRLSQLPIRRLPRYRMRNAARVTDWIT